MMIKTYPVNVLTINNLGKVSRKVIGLSASDAPTGLALEIINDNTIRLTWNDNSLIEDGYSIERSANGGAFSELDTVIPDTETYDDTTCIIDILYTYRVRGWKGGAFTGYSAEVSETIDEPQYRIFTDVTGKLWRKGIRDNTLILDVALTPTGFSGTEDVDWREEENIAVSEWPIT